MQYPIWFLKSGWIAWKIRAKTPKDEVASTKFVWDNALRSKMPDSPILEKYYVARWYVRNLLMA